MSNIFKPKRSNTASSVPTTGQLADGELAVNTVDKKIFVRDGASVVEVANFSAGGSGTNYWVQTAAGIHTLSSVGIGTTNPQATLQVGTGVSVYGTTGIVSAVSFYGSGINLTGIVTQIVAGTNVTISPVGGTGAVTINSTASGGSGTNYWGQTAAGIHTLSNVGIGTTNPTVLLEIGNVGDPVIALKVNSDAEFTNSIGIYRPGATSVGGQLSAGSGFGDALAFNDSINGFCWNVFRMDHDAVNPNIFHNYIFHTNLINSESAWPFLSSGIGSTVSVYINPDETTAGDFISNNGSGYSSFNVRGNSKLNGITTSTYLDGSSISTLNGSILTLSYGMAMP